MTLFNADFEQRWSGHAGDCAGLRLPLRDSSLATAVESRLPVHEQHINEGMAGDGALGWRFTGRCLRIFRRQLTFVDTVLLSRPPQIPEPERH